MPTYSSVSIEPAPAADVRLRLPVEERGAALKPDGPALIHTYFSDTYVLAEADVVQLQIKLVAWQIHPATCDELAALGPVDGPNAARWTIEGPLVHVPGDPGEATNCTMKLSVATSMEATPGSNWRDYEAGRYRLRSARARLIITRPSTAYDFRVFRFTLQATRISAPQRSRRLASGLVDSIPSGMSRVVVRDFRVAAGATLRIEEDAYLKIV